MDRNLTVRTIPRNRIVAFQTQIYLKRICTVVTVHMYIGSIHTKCFGYFLLRRSNANPLNSDKNAELGSGTTLLSMMDAAMMPV